MNKFCLFFLIISFGSYSQVDLDEFHYYINDSIIYSFPNLKVYGNLRIQDSLMKLCTDASIQKLEEYSEDKNPIMRAFAIEFLINKKEYNSIPKIIDHLKDNDAFRIQAGCGENIYSVCKYLYSLIDGNNFWNEKIRISENDKWKIDSTILYSDSISFELIERVLLTIDPKESNYKRIKKLALEKYLDNAYIALAKFQREADIPIFISMFRLNSRYSTLKSVFHFPNKIFIPYILEVAKKDSVELKGKLRFETAAVMMRYKEKVFYNKIKSSIKLENHEEFDNKFLRQIKLSHYIYPNKYYDKIINSIELNKYSKSSFEYDKEKWDKYKIESYY